MEVRPCGVVMTWDAYVHLAFDEIRLAGAGSPQVTRRLKAALTDLRSLALPDRIAVLEEQPSWRSPSRRRPPWRTSATPRWRSAIEGDESSARPRRSMRARSRSSEQVPLFRGWRNGYGGTPYQGVAHDSPVRSDRDGARLRLDPDPAGAAAVQELMGGRFGEMSTFMNYTFQSWNFRGRQGARLLRPRREHRRRGIRSRRARRDGDQHHAHGSDAGVQRTRSHRARDEEPARRREGARQPAPLPRRRPGRASAELAGQAVDRRLRLRRATSSRTSRTTSSWRPARGTTS